MRSERSLKWVVAGAVVIGLLGAPGSPAQTPRQTAVAPVVSDMPLPADRGSAALWQSLQKLHTRASLLMITAHPDDEDGGMLAMESRGRGARAALLTLNRGEGGQNVMSPDYWDALGLVRTEELLASDRYYGVQQYWTRVIDYGFSKTKEEALDKWGHDRVLYDVVRIIRMNRPLVLTAVFVGAVTDGHGQHQVSGEVAQEAFKVAGDPKVFPDQIRAGLRPWSPLKVYARVPTFSISDKGMYDYATGHWFPVRFYDYVAGKWIEGQPSTNLAIEEGQYDPQLGLSYLQVARQGLDEQKSQNGGTGIPAAGAFAIPYHRYGSQVATTDQEQSFFDGIDTSLPGIADLAQGDNAFLKSGLRQINGLVEQAMKDYSAQHPEKVAPTLAAGLKATNALIQQVESSALSADSKYDVLHELRIKQAQFNNAIVLALGFSLQATVAPEQEPTGPFVRFMGPSETFQLAIPGQEFGVKVHAVNQSSAPVQIQKVWLEPGQPEKWDITPASQGGGTLAGDQAADLRFQVKVPQDAVLTRPYFTRSDVEQSYYQISDERYLGRSLPPYPLSAWVEFAYDGVAVRSAQVVQTIHRVTGPGPVMEPLMLAPAISVSISPSAGISPLDEKSFTVTATVHSNVKGPARGTVRLELPASWQSTPAVSEFALANDGEDQSLSFQVVPGKLQEQPYTVTAVAEYGGKEYREGYHTAGYIGLRPYNLYRPASYETRGVDVKIAPRLNVGYIMGTGDEVPETLENLGVHVHFLGEQDVAGADLQKFDAIVLGVRTYAARPELRTYNNRLLDYVKNGGVVIVQYNTPQYDHNYGPYPYKLTGDPEKVVDETSKVNILDPKNPALTWPNQISTKDFEGWVEERGHDFMRSWDARWETPLETHDPDQDPQKGGLLYARYGKGTYIYIAYALYRQLPEGVPGAYRLFANLLSLARHP